MEATQDQDQKEKDGADVTDETHSGTRDEEMERCQDLGGSIGIEAL